MPLLPQNTLRLSSSCLLGVGLWLVAALSLASPAASQPLASPAASQPLASPAASQPYRLGPEDKVRIKVHEWRPSRGEVHEWTAMAGEYTISPAGTLSLPIIGDVPAAGTTLQTLSNNIAEQLRATAGLVERPVASVDLVQFRPFFIEGDVDKPGAYPYRPGLTVVRAISIAGGRYRRAGADPLQLEREAIVARGSMRVMQSDQAQLVTRRARLQAEIEGRSSIAYPQVLGTSLQPKQIADLQRQEQMLFDTRRRSFTTKAENLQKTKELVANEINALSMKEASLDKQLKLARRERDTVTALTEKGLAISSRQIAVEMNVAQLESARLDVGLSRVRAEQERSKLDRDLGELPNQRNNEILVDLRQTDTKLAELAETSGTQRQLLYHAEVGAPQELADRLAQEQAAVVATVFRGTGKDAQELKAEETTLLEPGDVVRVERFARPDARSVAQH